MPVLSSYEDSNINSDTLEPAVSAFISFGTSDSNINADISYEYVAIPFRWPIVSAVISI